MSKLILKMRMPFTKVKKLDTIKLLEESIGRTLHDINPKIFLVPLCRIIKIITKINGIQLNLKALHSKGNHKQNKKTTLRMGENICKQSNQLKGLISKIYKQLVQLNI